MNYTPEQIADMNDHNENFDGKTADFGKVQLYRQIKNDLEVLLQKCPDVCRIEELAPNKYEQNAVICLDVAMVSTFDKETGGLLSELIRRADRVIVGTDKTRIRFSFCVENVWTE